MRHNQNAEPFKITATCAREGLEDGGVQYAEVSLVISLMISLKALSDEHVSAAESKYGRMTHKA